MILFLEGVLFIVMNPGSREDEINPTRVETSELDTKTVYRKQL